MTTSLETMKKTSRSGNMKDDFKYLWDDTGNRDLSQFDSRKKNYLGSIIET